MTQRTIILLLASVLMASCAATNQPVADKNDLDILHIYPDGTMVLEGRTINEEDVVIYDDGRGGERAAIKLRAPLSRYKTQDHSEFYRDTIIVDRVVDETDEQGG